MGRQWSNGDTSPSFRADPDADWDAHSSDQTNRDDDATPVNLQHRRSARAGAQRAQSNSQSTRARTRRPGPHRSERRARKTSLRDVDARLAEILEENIEAAGKTTVGMSADLAGETVRGLPTAPSFDDLQAFDSPPSQHGEHTDEVADTHEAADTGDTEEAAEAADTEATEDTEEAAKAAAWDGVAQAGPETSAAAAEAQADPDAPSPAPSSASSVEAQTLEFLPDGTVLDRAQAKQAEIISIAKAREARLFQEIQRLQSYNAALEDQCGNLATERDELLATVEELTRARITPTNEARAPAQPHSPAAPPSSGPASTARGTPEMGDEAAPNRHPAYVRTSDGQQLRAQQSQRPHSEVEDLSLIANEKPDRRDAALALRMRAPLYSLGGVLTLGAVCALLAFMIYSARHELKHGMERVKISTPATYGTPSRFEGLPGSRPTVMAEEPAQQAEPAPQTRRTRRHRASRRR